MNHRRNFLTSALAAMAIPALAGTKAGKTVKPVDEHYTPGGYNGQYPRGRYAPDGWVPVSGYQTIPLPAPGSLYMIPLTTQQFDEANGQRFAMLGDGMITVMQSGLYTLNANLDLPAQHGVDTGSRKLLIMRVQNGQTPPTYTPKTVTLIKPNNGYDTMAGHDTSGSDVPMYSRATAAFPGASLQPGQVVWMDVPLSNPSVPIGTGDAATAGLPVPAGVVINAIVLSPNVVRVFIENRYGANALVVQPGTLAVAGFTTQTTTGNSVDAWMFVTSPLVELLAGEKLLLAFRTGVPGDFIQCDNLSFLQVTTFA